MSRSGVARFLSARRGLFSVLLVIMGASLGVGGLRVVRPGEIALVYRLGRLVGDDLTAIRQPGMLWAWPAPIDRVVILASKRETLIEIANTQSEQETSLRGDYLFTGDRGLVGIDLSARFVIASPIIHQRGAAAPRQIVERTVRRELQHVLLRSSMDDILQMRASRLPPPVGAPTEVNAAALVANLGDVVRERSQTQLEKMESGLRLTSIEVRSVHPPQEVRAAFDMLQTARIEQETTRARMVAQANEVRFDSESLARQAVAEAKGNVALRHAEIARQIAMFREALEGARKLGREAAARRLREAAWQEILARCGRAYFVAEPPAGGHTRLRIPGGNPSP